MYWQKEKAFAKINLYLDIEKKREDGFHDLFTIMQMVDFYDDVTVTLTHEKGITFTMQNAPVDVPTEKNLAYIAAKKFYESLDFVPNGGADIEIYKRIPMAAGLAGGSADAAAVLRALNYLYGKPFMLEDLCKLGATLGSDVPFNIVGGVQLCRGKGENMYRTYGIQHYNLLIAYGGEKLSTADQYRNLDKMYNDFKDYPIKEKFHQAYIGFETGRCTEAFGGMYNVFESLYENDETFKTIKEIMYRNEAKVAMLSGSGPAIFGIFPNSFYAEDAQAELKKQGIESYMCNPINKTYEYILPGEDPSRGI